MGVWSGLLDGVIGRRFTLLHTVCDTSRGRGEAYYVGGFEVGNGEIVWSYHVQMTADGASVSMPGVGMIVLGTRIMDL